MDSVLIATPFYYGKMYCLDIFLKSVESINYKNKKLLIIDNSPKDKQLDAEVLKDKLQNTKFDIIYLSISNRKFNSREVLAYSYAIALCYFEGYRFDYMLILEADVIIPPDGLNQLIETSKKYHGIVCGLVFRDKGKQIQAYKDGLKLWDKRNRDGLYRLERTPYTLQEIEGKTVVKIGSAAFSCLLIPAKYTKDLKINWFKDHYNHPDGFFFERVNHLNIPVWLNTKVKCDHLQKPWILDDREW